MGNNTAKRKVIIGGKELPVVPLEYIQSIEYPFYAKVKVMENEISAAGTHKWRKTFEGNIVENYPNHIVVLVHGVAGDYTRSINKVDLICGHTKVKFA